MSDTIYKSIFVCIKTTRKQIKVQNGITLKFDRLGKNNTKKYKDKCTKFSPISSRPMLAEWSITSEPIDW